MSVQRRSAMRRWRSKNREELIDRCLRPREEARDESIPIGRDGKAPHRRSKLDQRVELLGLDFEPVAVDPPSEELAGNPTPTRAWPRLRTRTRFGGTCSHSLPGRRGLPGPRPLHPARTGGARRRGRRIPPR
jgi:hypothetical protein